MDGSEASPALGSRPQLGDPEGRVGPGLGAARGQASGGGPSRGPGQAAGQGHGQRPGPLTPFAVLQTPNLCRGSKVWQACGRSELG